MKILPLSEITKLLNPTDTFAVPLATGQPMALLNALNDRQDWDRLELFCGLIAFPYPVLMNKKVFVTSGYYGPIERFLNEQGANMEYMPCNFRGIEKYARAKPARVVATTLSVADKDGYHSFGSHGAAVYRPFVEACRDPDRIAVAEINSNMPITYGLEEYGDNKIHKDKIDFAYETDASQAEMPDLNPTDVEVKIASFVESLIESGDTLQFGIGAIPDIIASSLASGAKSDFGVHSELISDGYLKMVEAGKVSNRNKAVFKDKTVFTFAFGKKNLYDFLDERHGKNNRSQLCLPVHVVNDVSQIAKNPTFTSINSGLMIDFSGQVCSESIAQRQYSGVGGQLSFVQGAYQAEKGKTILCIKSTAEVGGKLVSNIYSQLPMGSIISTPRHFTQYIVSEYGVANLYGVSDEKRPAELIKIAHPDFRDELQASYDRLKKTVYKI
ncbi:hypothetical protein BVY03_04545 [bacterium K02(2017)]|nr:hypothetical protein BVY03_04545 [bacterium K02(2017)]